MFTLVQNLKTKILDKKSIGEDSAIRTSTSQYLLSWKTVEEVFAIICFIRYYYSHNLMTEFLHLLLLQ